MEGCKDTHGIYDDYDWAMRVADGLNEGHTYNVIPGERKFSKYLVNEFILNTLIREEEDDD
jgi:hypothetical protein